MSTTKKYFAYIMGAVYILAGINHFWNTSFYTKLIADFLPYSLALVYISGVAEILCGFGLMIPSTRKAAAWGTVALLVAVSPTHIYMAMHPDGWGVSPVFLYARLPLQLLLIWWAWVYTKDEENSNFG